MLDALTHVKSCHYLHPVFLMCPHVSRVIYTKGKFGGMFTVGHHSFLGKNGGSSLLFGKKWWVITTFWKKMVGHNYFLEIFEKSSAPLPELKMNTP